MIDTTRTIEIEGSAAKLIILFICAIAMALVSLAIALIPEFRADIVVKITGYLGAAFFGLCALVALWRLFAARGPVVTISPQGIRDTRVAAGMIPWRDIRNVSTWSFQGQSAMVLAVDPAAESRLALSRIARWTRRANAALGADGLCVSATGLKIDYGTLFSAGVAYWQVHGRPA